MLLSVTTIDSSNLRPTMRDVAKLAGVSIKTVSRVVNSEPMVSDELTAKVQAAATQLGYRPNFTASTLRRSESATRTIGLLLKDVSNPFSAALLRAIEDTCRERGVVVISASVEEDSNRERQLSQALLSRQVDGLIVVPAPSNQSYLAREIERGTPVVFVDRPPVGLDADTVSTDNVRGAYDAVTHLLSRGHSRIAFLGDRPDISTATERLRGYQQALFDNAVPGDPELIAMGVNSQQGGIDRVRELLLRRNPPTALFTAQNLITIGAVRALRDLNLQRRVALFGFDDFQLSDLLDPPVAVVEQDVYRLGQLAAETLFARREGSRTGPGEHMQIPARLLVRESGNIPPL